MSTTQRRFLIFSGVLLGTSLFSGNVSATTALFERNLYFGLRSDPDVVRLQEFLSQTGLYNGPANGNFFSLTLEGVKKFQQANSIEPAAGYFGAKTRAIANAKHGGGTEALAPLTDKSYQIQILQQQIASLIAQLANIQHAQITTTTTPAISESATTSPAVVVVTTQGVATTTPILPKIFDSTLKIESTYPAYTLNRFSAVILNELVFNADEKIAITKLQFKNIGTLEDENIVGLNLINSKTGDILSKGNLKNGVVTFAMTSSPDKNNNGLVVSGGIYDILADNILGSPNVRRTIEFDIESASDISAFDYNDLLRAANLKSIKFPIEGPLIKTY